MKSLYLLSLLVLAAGCKKDLTEEEKLPQATQEGKNSGGFLLDGQAWLPKNSVTSSSTQSVRASWLPYGARPGKHLSIVMIRVVDGRNDETGLNLYLPYAKRPGTYALDQLVNPVIVSGAGSAFAAYGIEHPSPRRLFLTGPDATGTLTLTRFDTVARVASGSFELSVREYGGTDTRQLTRGRFDVRF